jgi:hypothetical protein
MTGLVIISVIVIWVLLSACICVSACIFSAQLSHAEEDPIAYRRLRSAPTAPPAIPAHPEISNTPAKPSASASR